MLQLHPFRPHVEVSREPPLEPDRHVAEAERAMTFVQKRLGHQPRRVREVDEPGSGVPAASGFLRQLQHHGDRAQCLGEPTGPGGLLADAPEPKRDRLVLEARGLTAHAQLDDDEVGALERLVSVAGQRQVPRPAHAA